MPYSVALQAIGKAMLDLLAKEHLMFLVQHDQDWMRTQEMHVVRKLHSGLLDMKRWASLHLFIINKYIGE